MFKYDKLIFRKVDENDLIHLLRLKRDSWQFTHRTAFLNRSDQKKWYDSLNSNPTSPSCLVFVVDLDANEFHAGVGMFKIDSIDYVSRTAEVGWVVDVNYRGYGWGKKLVTSGCRLCFDILNLRRLSCEILSNNPASLACANNAGFKIEGTKKQAVFKEDKYLDSHVMGLLKTDFIRV